MPLVIFVLMILFTVLTVKVMQSRGESFKLLNEFNANPSDVIRHTVQQARLKEWDIRNIEPTGVSLSKSTGPSWLVVIVMALFFVTLPAAIAYALMSWKRSTLFISLYPSQFGGEGMAIEAVGNARGFGGSKKFAEKLFREVAAVSALPAHSRARNEGVQISA